MRQKCHTRGLLLGLYDSGLDFNPAITTLTKLESLDVSTGGLDIELAKSTVLGLTRLTKLVGALPLCGAIPADFTKFK